MKKLFSIMLVAAMAVGFAACGGDNARSTSGSSSTNESASANEKDGAVQAVEDATVPTDTFRQFMQYLGQITKAAEAGDQATVDKVWEEFKEFSLAHQDFKPTLEQEKQLQGAALQMAFAAENSGVKISE